MTNQEERKKESMFTFHNITRDKFCNYINESKEDKFAKTFKSKADYQNQWSWCVGAFQKTYTTGLLGAIITTHSKREPKVANLQLLHTFYKHRNMGVAKHLVLHSIARAMLDQCMYFRVSAEPEAIGFYRNIGFKMLGEQKSGCQLSMFRIETANPGDGIYDLKDKVIYNSVYKKGKGGCVKVFDGL